MGKNQSLSLIAAGTHCDRLLQSLEAVLPKKERIVLTSFHSPLEIKFYLFFLVPGAFGEITIISSSKCPPFYRASVLLLEHASNTWIFRVCCLPGVPILQSDWCRGSSQSHKVDLVEAHKVDLIDQQI